MHCTVLAYILLVLFFLIDSLHLHLCLCRVAQQESTNRMSPYNLAVIFAPCLFQGETKSKNPQDFIKELAKQTA